MSYISVPQGDFWDTVKQIGEKGYDAYTTYKAGQKTTTAPPPPAASSSKLSTGTMIAIGGAAILGLFLLARK